MSTPISARMIGLFTIGATVILVSGILVFGSGNFAKHEYPVQMVFTADVKGLNVGAPITYRGVRVGEVTSIDFHLKKPGADIVIIVSGKLVPQQSDSLRNNKEMEEFLSQQIEKGLKAQLVSKSILTGLVEVQLDYFPDLPGHVFISPNTPRSIPTVQTDYEIITDTVKSLATQLGDIPLRTMINDLGVLIAEIRKLVTHEDLRRSMSNFAEMVEHLNSFAAKLDSQNELLLSQILETSKALQKMSADVSAVSRRSGEVLGTGEQVLNNGADALKKFKQTLGLADATLQSYQKLVEPGSEVSVSLIQALRSLERASEQVRQLAETLERNPESLFTGKQH